MRSTVQGIALFTSAVSAALGQALVGLSEDPLLVWNYGSVAVVAMIGAIGFWFTFRTADKEEDRLNNLKRSKFVGRVEGHEEDHIGHVESVHEKSDMDYKK